MKKIFIIIILALMICFSSCGNNNQSSYSVLMSLLSAIPSDGSTSLPSGRIYYYYAEGENTNIYESPESKANILECPLATSLFGKSGCSQTEYPVEFGLIKNCAVWISSSLEFPCEISVFKVKSIKDTSSICKMLIRRLDTLKKFFRETEYYDMLERVSVSVSGDIIILAIINQ